MDGVRSPCAPSGIGSAKTYRRPPRGQTEHVLAPRAATGACDLGPTIASHQCESKRSLIRCQKSLRTRPSHG
eukprot:1334247-Pyramimonas_sp.AAC.1